MTEDREKVISGFEDFVKSFSKRDDTYYKGLFVSVLALLKEQEPVKPNLDIDEWMCGNCGHKLEHQELLGDNMLYHEQYNYCPNCGRKVKWDDVL